MVLAGAGRFGVSRGYNYQILAPKGAGGVAGAHQARKRRKGPGEVDGEADRRRSGDGDRGRGSAAVLRAPGLRGSARGAPAVVSRGQDGLKATGGDGIASAELLTSGGRSALARRRR